MKLIIPILFLSILCMSGSSFQNWEKSRKYACNKSIVISTKIQQTENPFLLVDKHTIHRESVVEVIALGMPATHSNTKSKLVYQPSLGCPVILKRANDTMRFDVSTLLKKNVHIGHSLYVVFYGLDSLSNSANYSYRRECFISSVEGFTIVE